MADGSIFQLDRDAAEQNRIRCEKGRQLLTVIVVVNLFVSLISGILNMQFVGFLLQLALAFFLFKGSQIAKGFYILFAFLNILSGFLCFVLRNDIMDQVQGALGETDYVHNGLRIADRFVPAFGIALIVIGVCSILWGIFMMFALMKNKNLIHYLEYQKESA